MKKLNFKRVLTAVLALAMLATMFVLPTNAALPETTVQEWDFSGFQDGNYVGIDDTQHAGSVEKWFPEIGEYSTDLADLKSADQKVVLGIWNPYWNLKKYWNINDGTVTFNGKHHPDNKHAFVISLKLDEELQAGVKYTLNTDLAFTLEKWVNNMSVYYSNSLNTASSAAATRGKAPNGSTVLYKNYRDEENTNGFGADSIPKTVVFTPENDLPAGGYISFRVDAQLHGATSAIPMTATATFFKLTANIPYAVDNDYVAYDDWDFTGFEDGVYAGDNVNKEFASANNDVVLGLDNAWWQQWKKWTIENSNVTFVAKPYPDGHHQFVLSLKLNEDFEAGKQYKLLTDLDMCKITEAHKYAPKDLYVYYSPKKDNLPRTDTVPTVTGHEVLYSQTGSVTSLPKEYVFTPENDMAAGGYINIRLGVTSLTADVVITLSNIKLCALPTKVLRKYDFTTAEDRACVVGDTTNQVSVIEEATVGGNSEYAGKTALNWKNRMLTLKDFKFESDKYYKVTMVYATYSAKTLNLYAYNMDPETYELTGKSWRTNGVATLPGTGATQNFTESSFDFYSRTDIDYENGQVPVFYHSANDKFIIVSLTISEYTTKVTAMKATAPAVPTESNRLYTKIVLPAINTALQQYAMVDNEGNVTAITGNTVTGLNYDTEYQFVVKYIDSYKYLEGEYSEAITVKTRKLGDVTGDEKVDIVDLVRIKKGLADDPDNAVYDIEPDGGEAGSLVYMRRIILGLVK